MQLIIESPDEKVIQKILEMIRPFNVTFHQVITNDAVLESAEIYTTPKRPSTRVRKLGVIPGLSIFGSAKGKYQISADFDEPLDAFKDYM